MSNKAVLAYSGGLDTSYCLVNLTKDQGMEVHTVIVNTGGFSEEELKEIETRAYELGSSKHVTIDITDKYYNDCVRFLIYGNVLKNNTYPLSVSAERMFQSIAIAQYAKDVEAEYIVHGSTGAGNDQIRFDVAFAVISPQSKIITPIRDEKLSRQQEVEYLQANGVNYSWEQAKYSINRGIWGTSVGGVETLTSNQALPEEAYPTQLSRTEPSVIEIEFEKGIPTALDGKKLSPVALIQQLNEIGGEYAIGRDIHVGDTILGIKGRVGFEAPAAYLLIKAHHLLEKHTLTRWQLLHKDSLSNWYGTLLHEAQYLDPVMRDIEAFLESSQEKVTGKVKVQLNPYHFSMIGIESPYDMMQSKVAVYGEENDAWDSRDARGFIKIFGNQLKIVHSFD
ncbi:argininosuccinate synthase [Empedobacter stercoris]|uniref:argininosuccinate synthase n=1 Tax=Empedobacter falsenii TaxID=343874 RepID=A0ABY8V7D8_9FLAO|nr:MULTISPECIES: argininosuccinate synthase [Empedobacter]MCA4780715.1 argininosuccinate synthase [Empedobacter stercoris]UWX66671.1 argininosuccinate synthase [Empedobacter stercoris]WIH96851.1 argininosuccinate synthase [Empedobacter falsenii]